MLFFYLNSTTPHWFSLHSWIDTLLYVLPIHWKNLILMNNLFNDLGGLNIDHIWQQHIMFPSDLGHEH
jgi:hypothetical protein